MNFRHKKTFLSMKTLFRLKVIGIIPFIIIVLMILQLNIHPMLCLWEIKTRKVSNMIAVSKKNLLHYYLHQFQLKHERQTFHCSFISLNHLSHQLFSKVNIFTLIVINTIRCGSLVCKILLAFFKNFQFEFSASF